MRDGDIDASPPCDSDEEPSKMLADDILRFSAATSGVVVVVVVEERCGDACCECISASGDSICDASDVEEEADGCP